MDQGIAPATVALYTVALAVGVILFLFIGTWLTARYLQVKTRGMLQIVRQVAALEAERRGTPLRWRRWRFLIGPLSLLLVVASLVTGLGALALPILLLTLPASAIIYGLEIREVGYVTLSLPLQPTRLYTGDQAARVGSLYVAGGLLLLVPCLALSMLSGFSGLLLSKTLP